MAGFAPVGLAVRPVVTDVYEFVTERPLGGGNYGQARAHIFLV